MNYCARRPGSADYSYHLFTHLSSVHKTGCAFGMRWTGQPRSAAANGKLGKETHVAD